MKLTAMVKEAHASKMQVHPYTVRADQLPPYATDVNQLYEVLYKQADVDGLFTDFPDKAVTFLNRKRAVRPFFISISISPFARQQQGKISPSLIKASGSVSQSTACDQTAAARTAIAFTTLVLYLHLMRFKRHQQRRMLFMAQHLCTRKA